MLFNLCLLGFGNVGRELVKLIDRKRDELLAQYNLDLRVVGVATGRHGSVMDRNGLGGESAIQSRLQNNSPRPDSLALIR